jgi:hypothetical protein
MKILIVGTSTDPRLHVAGFNLAYEKGFTSLGHHVTSISHKQIPSHAGNAYDFILLRDTTINVPAMKHLAACGKHFAVFTHAEFNQGRRDADILAELEPEVVFLDQPLGGYVFRELPFPSIFLGYGANMDTRIGKKDIDVLWVGHGYPARQQEVVNNVWPLRDLPDFNVKIHGYGQPDGPLAIPDMLETMSRAKIVIHIGSPGVTDRGGYGGRRIYDALASGSFVISTWFPLCHAIFPFGVEFTNRDNILGMSKMYLDEPDSVSQHAYAGFEWARQCGMVSHKCQAMLDSIMWGE